MHYCIFDIVAHDSFISNESLNVTCATALSITGPEKTLKITYIKLKEIFLSV